MKQQTLGTQNILVIASVIFFAITLPVSGQEQDAEPSPRTAWGDPDLQGIWNNNTITPLQRPAEFADQELLTTEEAEVAVVQKKEEWVHINQKMKINHGKKSMVTH